MLIFLALLVVWLPVLALLMHIASLVVIVIDAMIAGTANMIAIYCLSCFSTASVLTGHWFGSRVRGDGEHVCCVSNKKKDQHY